jgi:hypothetical protein
VLNASGEILFRRGLPGTDNQYAPPVIVNPDRPARDLTLVRTAAGMAIAVSDLTADTVSVYTFSGTAFTRTAIVAAGRLPQRIAAADLDGNGLDDLVIANTLDNSLTVAFQQADGSFISTFPALPVGVTPSDIALLDVDGQDGLDIVVSNRSSGDIDVLFNDPAHTFARTARYRAGLGVSGLQDIDGRLNPSSREEPVSLVAGQFTSDTLPDLVVVDRGAHQFGTLIGTPGGGFTNPQEDFRFSTSQGLDVNDRPGQVVAADFDRDGKLDIAILMEDRGEVWLYKGLGNGRFTLLSRVPAGNAPTGLAVDDVNNDGNPDLMVGNDFGDILFILGNGDGTFRPFIRTDQRVPFVVTDLNGDGVLDVVLGDQARDLASSQIRVPDTGDFTPGAFQRDGRNGLIGPGDVVQADLDGHYGTDLIFANTGSNNVLVYLRQPDGSFADQPLSFFAGTSPTALHVADLNGDGMPDLVIANQGSNDVSVLLGSHDAAGNWTFRLGPRLKSGGLNSSAQQGKCSGLGKGKGLTLW